MVPRSREAVGPRRIRAVNEPRRLDMKTDGAGVPVAFRPETPLPGPGRPGRIRAGWNGPAHWYRVEQVLDMWRIDEGWWRPRPIHRTYYRLFLRHGAVVDVYFDEVDGRWYEQRYD